MPFVLTNAGLQTQTQQELYAELYARLQLIFGGDVDEETSSNIGQLVNLESEYHALYQQVTLAAFSSFDPAFAAGVALDQRAALTGSLRVAAYGSTVVLRLTTTGDIDVNDGDQFREVDGNTLWTVYGGQFSRSGAGTLDVTARCDTTGEVPALADSSWEAVASYPNLDSITNPDDATLGEDTELDAAFRIRRQREIYAAGQGPLAAITGRVSRVNTDEDGRVVFVRTYHNPATPGVDSNGIPFKAFNVVVRTNPAVPNADLQQAIFDAIYKGMGLGGHAYGTSYVGQSVDGEGVPHNVAFDVVTDVAMEMRLYLTTSTAEQQPTPNMEDIVRAEIVRIAQLEHEQDGRDVVALDYVSIVGGMKRSGEIRGVDGVVCYVRAVGDPGWVSTQKRAISIRERPTFSAARVFIFFN